MRKRKTNYFFMAVSVYLQNDTIMNCKSKLAFDPDTARQKNQVATLAQLIGRLKQYQCMLMLILLFSSTLYECSN